MRCFIALDLPPSLQDALVSLQNELRSRGLFFGKFTSLQNLHLTLKFLGEIKEEQAEEVKEKLRTISFPSFLATLPEAGLFSPKFIRIIWATLEQDKVLPLQKQIDEALSFPKEKRFMSHITIARVKKVDEKEKLIEALKKLELPKDSFPITSFSLQASTLTKEGPRYEVLERYELKN